MPAHILDPRVIPGLLEFPRLAETLNNLFKFPRCVWSWTEDSATLMFKCFVHLYSNYHLDFKIDVYLCIFQSNVFYCLKWYCHVKNKKLNKPVHFSINCKLFCTGKLNKKLTLNPKKNWTVMILKPQNACQIYSTVFFQLNVPTLLLWFAFLRTDRRKLTSIHQNIWIYWK